MMIPCLECCRSKTFTFQSSMETTVMATSNKIDDVAELPFISR
jgi:hypothetical protein